MIRGTTPTFTFTIRPKRQTDILQGRTELDKTDDDMEISTNTVEVWLTQEESLKLAEGGNNCEIQINWTYLDSNDTVRRAATRVKSIPIDKQLLRRVIE